MFPKNARSGASRRRAFALVALAALVCALSAGRAAAQEADRFWLKPDLTVEQQWNSNIFSDEDDEQGSLVTVVRPSLTFLNEGERGYLFLNGWLSNHTYWEESDLNGADRGGSLRVDRKLTPRVDLFGSGSLTRFTDRDEVRTDVGETGLTEVLAAGAPDVDTHQANLGVRYRLSPRTRSELTGGPSSISYARHPVGATTYRDRMAWFANWRLSHQLDPLDTLQLDLAVSVTDQDSATSAPLFRVTGADGEEDLLSFDTGESRSQQQSATLGWERVWSPVWRSTIQVGVRRLDSRVSGASRQASQPVLRTIDLNGEEPGGVVSAYAPTATLIPVDFDDVGPALVGTLLVQRTFPRSALTLAYQRETQVNSGALSSDVDVDVVSLTYRHRLAERVTLSLTGEFNHYISANDSPQFVPAFFTPVPVDEWDGSPGYTCGGLFGPGGKLIVTGDKGQCEVGTSSELSGQRLIWSAKLDWQLRKRLASYLVFRYYDQRSDPGLLGEDFNKYTIGVGFRYAYDFEL